MLHELAIKNFAIIDDLRIGFSDGLTILSGETGAGKSIIINAVNLLLGGRATAKLIRTGAEAAELEALFAIAPGCSTAEIMATHGFDPSEGLLIRRVISRNDRHRIYINGRLSTIHILNAVTENLASISGQHAHQGLLKEEHHLQILDQFGGLTPLRAKVSTCFHKMLPLIQKLNELKAFENRQTEHMELLSFQQKEIMDAAITPGEDNDLEQERLRLKNIEALCRTVQGGWEELYSSQGAIVERLVQVRKHLEKAVQIDPALTSDTEKLADFAFRIEDIAQNLRGYLDALPADDRRLEEVEVRLAYLNKLKRKYGPSLEHVLQRLDDINDQLSKIENISGDIVETESQLADLHRKLVESATTLSQKRVQIAQRFARRVELELASLEMPRTRFEADLKHIPSTDRDEPYLRLHDTPITDTGMDRVTFLMAPNVGETLKPLVQIASGGELSRVVLALKAILAASESVETVVFDEVDAGIGGRVAEVLGRKLAALAVYHQTICITHLPQIAKFGKHHFKISKQVSGGRTRTLINPLNDTERIEEIARMLGGVRITRKTLDHAREMLGES